MVSRAALGGWPLVPPSKKDYGRNILSIAPGALGQIIEDSTGVGVGNDGVGTGQVARSWPTQWAAILRRRGVHASTQNRFGCASGSLSAPNGLLGLDARVTATGAWSNTGTLVPGGNAFGVLTATAGSQTVDLGWCTKIMLDWVDSTAGRAFEYLIDDGNPVEVPTTGNYAVRRPIITVPRGRHSITIRQKTGVCNIRGVEAWDDTDGMPIRLRNYSISGATSTQLVDNSDITVGRRAGYSLDAPDFVIAELGGINDAVNGVVQATSKANLLAAAAAVRVNNPACKVIFRTPNPIGESAAIRTALEGFVQVMKEAAAEVGNGLIDVYGAWGNYENAVRMGYMADARHPNTAGYAAIAAQVDRAVTIN